MAATSSVKKSSLAGMPIEDYDRLSVKAILPGLTTLSDAELRAVVAYEKAGKNRVTLLQAARKIELSREAAAQRSAPTSHLTVVADEIEDEAEPVVVSAPAPEPKARSKSKAPRRTSAKAKSTPPVVTTIEMAPEPDESDEVETAPSRPAAKHATWEEEPRPQLPRRLEASSFDLEFEPSVVAWEAPEMELPAPMAVSASLAPSSVPGIFRRKIEGPALVMAAVLAVLLGLAIGTVLARSGSVAAQPTAGVATVAAEVQSGG